MEFGLVFFFGFMAFVFFMGFSKYGRGKMLGGKIIWSGKEHQIEESKFSGMKSFVQVHGIEGRKVSDENKIGIELRSRSYMHFSTQPISLTTEQAKELIKELDNAINKVST